jgi:hypothetical protein
MHYLPTTLTISRDYSIHNLALTSTQSFPISSASKIKRGHPFSPSSTIKTLGVFDISTLNGTTIPADTMPETVDQTILVYTKMEVLSHLGNVPAGFINRTSWAPQSSPLVDLERAQWDKNQLVPWIPISEDPSKEKWVDIVVNNLDEKGHPFHLVSYFQFHSGSARKRY